MFVQPTKVEHIKKSATRGEKVTWFQAFVKAIQLRGRPKRDERIVSSSGAKKLSCLIVFTKMKGGCLAERMQRLPVILNKTSLNTINTTSTKSKPKEQDNHIKPQTSNDMLVCNPTPVQSPHPRTTVVRFEDDHVAGISQGTVNNASSLF